MQKQVIGSVMAVTAAVCWGVVANAGEFLVGNKGFDAVQLTSLRLIAGGLIFLAISALQGNRLSEVWISRKDRSELLITGIVGFGICQASFFLSIRMSNGGTASVLQNTAPVFVLIYTIFHEHRAPQKDELLSVAAVIIGALLLTTGGNLSTLAASASGVLLGLLSAVTVALYSILPVRLMQKFGSITVSGWALLLGGLFLLPFSRMQDFSGVVDLCSILVFLFLVLVGTVATFGLYMRSLPLIGPLKAAVICLLEPVVATIVTIVFFHTAFSAVSILGLGIILCGILVLTIASARQTVSDY